MEGAENKFLCLPCAVRLQGCHGVEVRIGSSARYKDTCENCGRRKYGYNCIVRTGVDAETTKEREMCVCPRCRGELERKLSFELIEDARPQRRTCRICGKKTYTALFRVKEI